MEGAEMWPIIMVLLALLSLGMIVFVKERWG